MSELQTTVNEYTVTPEDLAKRYGVSDRTITRWANQGKLPEPLRIGRRYLRWRPCDIEAFEKRD